MKKLVVDVENPGYVGIVVVPNLNEARSRMQEVATRYEQYVEKVKMASPTIIFKSGAMVKFIIVVFVGDTFKLRGLVFDEWEVSDRYKEDEPYNSICVLMRYLDRKPKSGKR